MKNILIFTGSFLLLGAIVFLIIDLMRKKQNKEKEPASKYYSGGSQEADKPTVGYKHPCRYCKEMILPNSNICPYCGKESPLGPIRCPRCHNPIERNWQKCNHCGLELMVTCPHCQKRTFFDNYCDQCDKRLTVICPSCHLEQPPIENKCSKCGTVLLS